MNHDNSIELETAQLQAQQFAAQRKTIAHLKDEVEYWRNQADYWRKIAEASQFVSRVAAEYDMEMAA